MLSFELHKNEFQADFWFPHVLSDMDLYENFDRSNI